MKSVRHAVTEIAFPLLRQSTMTCHVTFIVGCLDILVVLIGVAIASYKNLMCLSCAVETTCLFAFIMAMVASVSRMRRQLLLHRESVLRRTPRFNNNVSRVALACADRMDVAEAAVDMLLLYEAAIRTAKRPPHSQATPSV